MQAIRVRFLGPTNKLGARWKADCDVDMLAGRATVYPQPGEDPKQARDRAALKLCAKLGWFGTLHSGCLRGGAYAYVFDEDGPVVVPKAPEPAEANAEPVEAIPDEPAS
jgi:hypothetical protein